MSWDDPDKLDAPRFASSTPPKGRVLLSPLQQLIVDFRAALADEAPVQMHARSTPRLLNDDGTTDRKDADERGIGLPLTSRMHRYIGHWSHWGRSRLATLSIMEVSDMCHARHTGHTRPGSDRSLCAQMLYEVGRLGQEPSDLAWIHGLPLEQVERMLAAALRHAAEWRRIEEDPILRHARRPRRKLTMEVAVGHS